MSWKEKLKDEAFYLDKDEGSVGGELYESLAILRRYLDGKRRTCSVLEALRHLEYVCGQPVKSATTQLRRCLFWEDESARNDVAQECLIEIGGWINRNKRVQRRMTILPYDRYFSRWQRAKARSQALLEDFKSWCADGNARLPDSWSPDALQAGFAEILAEAEKVSDEHRKAREDS